MGSRQVQEGAHDAGPLGADRHHVVERAHAGVGLERPAHFSAGRADERSAHLEIGRAQAGGLWTQMVLRRDAARKRRQRQQTQNKK